MMRLLPLCSVMVLLFVWEWLVRILNVNPFVLPAPSAIFLSGRENAAALFNAAGFTLLVCWIALFIAIVTGVVLGLWMHRSRIANAAFTPLALALQVTPIVAIAPIILVWTGVDHPERALVIIAWIVAFFPIMAATTTGLKSVPNDLRDLFHLYRANGWQTFKRLEFPAILPGFLGGLKVSAGLSLIGAVVAEFAAGSGDSSGLAWSLIQSVQTLDLPKAFACLFLLTAIGIAQFAVISWIEARVLRARGL
jgi:NitT/TauT family transport system permease protein